MKKQIPKIDSKVLSRIWLMLKKVKSEKYYLALLFGGYLFWFVQYFPGLYDFDSFTLANDVNQGIFSDWYSYPFAVMGWLASLVSPDLFVLVVFQIILVSMLLSKILGFLSFDRKAMVYSFIVCLIFIVSPINPRMTLYLSRDLTFSWLFIGILFYFFHTSYKSQKIWTYGQLTILALLCGLSLAFRKDAIVLVLLIPILGGLLKVFWGRKFFYFAFMQGFLSFIFVVLIPKPFVSSTDPHIYKLTTFINPLSYTLKMLNGRTGLSVEENMTIEKVAYIDDFVDYQNDYEIDLFHVGKANLEISKEEADQFFNTSLKLFKTYPQYFIQNRLNMAAAILQMKEQSWFPPDDLATPISQTHTYAKESREKWNLRQVSLSNFINYKLDRYANYILNFKKGYIYRILFASGLVGLFMCYISLFCFVWTPLSSAIGLIVLARFFAVVIATPAPSFKYIYTLYVFGWLVPLFMYFEYKKMKPETVKKMDK